ncbi:DUF4406 domain-containing protein [Paraburkholderia sp. CNPSo 3281]|uniref:DUF4406 domain-containing protein n=1 Tax=Paraburkholderia sp. CNPSo 3281 TaxID=2940933 RepID=UPI0020B6EC22|nr:DUF4406 domain-containing protein [Paraburkholderia sp. CNPSo 3281]MCP3721384.1 DUF4406 domain-containing protein [Paraburkholderia sp. CNPSo 3281]
MMKNVNESNIELEQKSMFDALACAIDKHGATYVSGPITTGRRYVEWYLSEGYACAGSPNFRDRLRDAVIRQNEIDILKVAAKARARGNGVVIEPASLHKFEWGQDDYASFWCGVIERFVGRLIMLDGWQFSLGCVAEFHEARRLRIPIENQHGDVLDYSFAKHMVEEAVKELEARHFQAASLENLTCGLRSYALQWN